MLITVLLVCIVVGVVLWAVKTYVPMDANIKRLMTIAVIIILVIWLLRVFGVFSYLEHKGL